MPDANITRQNTAAERARRLGRRADSFQLVSRISCSDQPRITVTYQDADIRDVIAAFATFSGRTIVVGKDVAGTGHGRDQEPAVGRRASRDSAGTGTRRRRRRVSGIITVDSYKNIHRSRRPSRS